MYVVAFACDAELHLCLDVIFTKNLEMLEPKSCVYLGKTLHVSSPD